jgi:hypothetical protein
LSGRADLMDFGGNFRGLGSPVRHGLGNFRHRPCPVEHEPYPVDSGRGHFRF